MVTLPTAVCSPVHFLSSLSVLMYRKGMDMSSTGAWPIQAHPRQITLIYIKQLEDNEGHALREV